jgi:hypothetical protein
MKTTIEVKKQTANRIQIAKYTLGCSTADETINKILDIVKRINEANKYEKRN